MINHNQKTKVVHSLSKNAWNVIGIKLGTKFKIAHCPYIVVDGNKKITESNRLEAYNHANFISDCFNDINTIVKI